MDKVSLKEVNTFDEMMKMDGWIMTEIQFYSISPSVLVFPFSFENGSTQSPLPLREKKHDSSQNVAFVFFKYWLLHVTPLTQFLTTAEQVGVKSKFIKHWNTSAWKRFGLLLQSVNLHLQTMWADIMKEDIFREQCFFFSQSRGRSKSVKVFQQDPRGWTLHSYAKTPDR